MPFSPLNFGTFLSLFNESRSHIHLVNQQGNLNNARNLISKGLKNVSLESSNQVKVNVEESNIGSTRRKSRSAKIEPLKPSLSMVEGSKDICQTRTRAQISPKDV